MYYPDAPYVIGLVCLTPDIFIRQGSVLPHTQWVEDMTHLYSLNLAYLTDLTVKWHTSGIPLPQAYGANVWTRVTQSNAKSNPDKVNIK